MRYSWSGYKKPTEEMKKNLKIKAGGGYQRQRNELIIFLIPHPLAVGFPQVPSPWGEG